MRLDDVMFILKSIPLFRQVDTEALRILAFSATRRQLRAGDILFRRGDHSDGGYLVIEGEISLDRLDDGAPSPHVFGAGTLIGQSALFTTIERPGTAIARETASVLVFTRELMRKVLDAYPQSAVALHNALTEQARQFSGAIAATRLPG